MTQAQTRADDGPSEDAPTSTDHPEPAEAQPSDARFETPPPPSSAGATYPPPPPEPPRYHAVARPDVHPARHRRPGFAAFLSIFPGLGNIYNGLFYRGLLNFLIFFSLVFTAAEVNDGPELALIIPSIIFTWCFGLVDAYRQATFINYGITDASPAEGTRFKAPSGNVAVGVALFAIGLYGLLRELFSFNLEFLVEHWYVFIMLFGGWMIYQGIQARRAGNELEATEF